MPFYEYRCASCQNLFELRRSSDQASMPAECPACAGPGRRVLSMFQSPTRHSALERIGGAPAASGGGGCCGGSCGCRN